MHKEELRIRQMRRCISFREIREYESDDSGMMDSDDEGQNWISEPGSPRSKEMLLNANFNKRMNELSKAYFMRD